MFTIYVNRIPIPKVSSDNEMHINSIVDELIESNDKERREELLNQLDCCFYELYELNKEHIELIEKSYER